MYFLFLSHFLINTYDLSLTKMIGSWLDSDKNFACGACRWLRKDCKLLILRRVNWFTARNITVGNNISIRCFKLNVQVDIYDFSLHQNVQLIQDKYTTFCSILCTPSSFDDLLTSWKAPVAKRTAKNFILLKNGILISTHFELLMKGFQTACLYDLFL